MPKEETALERMSTQLICSHSMTHLSAVQCQRSPPDILLPDIGLIRPVSRSIAVIAHLSPQIEMPPLRALAVLVTLFLPLGTKKSGGRFTLC